MPNLHTLLKQIHFFESEDLNEPELLRRVTHINNVSKTKGRKEKFPKKWKKKSKMNLQAINNRLLVSNNQSQIDKIQEQRKEAQLIM